MLFTLRSGKLYPLEAQVSAPLPSAPPESAMPAAVERESADASRAPASSRELVVEPTPDAATAATARAVEREASESWRAIQQLLADPELLDACARPTEIASETLIALVTKARNACSRESQALIHARIEAGLFERIPGYVPGQPVGDPAKDNKTFRSITFTETGDAGRVILERVDHPELYDLAERVTLLEEELEARQRPR